MKEIKFRVWDKQLKKYYEPFDIFSQEHALFVSLIYASNGKDRYVFEEFVRLSDKNKKEIYEGDIADIRYYGGGHTKDMFTPCVCKFGKLFLDPQGESNSMGFYFEQVNGPNTFGLDKCKKVIGNIHENPELLIKKE